MLGESLKNKATAYKQMGSTTQEYICLQEAVPLLDDSYGPEHPRSQADVSQKEKMNPLQVILAIAAAAILVVYAVTGLSIPEMISEMGYATSFAECNLIVLSRSNKVECAILKKENRERHFCPSR